MVRDPSVAVCAKRLVELAVVAKKVVEVAFTSVTLPVKELVPLNVLFPAKVLLLERSVVEEMVMSAVPLKETPLMRRAVWSCVAVAALPPIESEEVAAEYALLLASSAMMVFAERPVNQEAPVMVTLVDVDCCRLSWALMVVDAEKTLLPLKVLLFASKVVEATTMLAVPSNDIPLMVRAVCK